MFKMFSRLPCMSSSILFALCLLQQPSLQRVYLPDSALISDAAEILRK